MKFCPKCGSLMLPKKQNNENVYECKCGYNEIGGETKLKSESKGKKIEEIKVPDSSEEERLPICEIECEKCGNKECYFWEIQTRASDEPPTRFYKCTKCKYTWREYS